MKKTIVIDCRMIHHSGIGTFLQNVVKGLLLKKEFHLSLLVPTGVEKQHKFLSLADLIFFDTPIYSPWEQLHFPRKIPSCDLFWSPHFNAPLLPVMAKKRLLTLHDIYHISHPHCFSFFKNQYVKLLYTRAIARADRITTVSNFSQIEIEKAFPQARNKVEVIHNGIDLKLFSPTKDPNNYALPEKFFLFVGSIKPHKNLRKLLEAFEDFLLTHGDFHLVIIGKKEGLHHKDALENLLSRNALLDKVHFFHHVTNEELPHFYSNAYALIFPSLYEGFGLPPLEAMSCGCPVLASHCTSIPEVCKDAVGYFDPRDTSQIRQAMKGLVSNPDLKARLIEKGNARVKAFAWETATEKYLKLMHRIVDENSVRS